MMLEENSILKSMFYNLNFFLSENVHHIWNIYGHKHMNIYLIGNFVLYNNMTLNRYVYVQGP